MKEKSDLKVKRDDKVEKKYTRTLQFIFIKATLDLYPNSKIAISKLATHSLHILITY